MTEIYAEDGTLVCRGKTTWGYIDIATARPSRIPQEIRAAFKLAE